MGMGRRGKGEKVREEGKGRRREREEEGGGGKREEGRREEEGEWYHFY